MADLRSGPPPIGTKLTRPGVRDDLIARPRLIARLDERRPLVAAVAPAGYGKTTLLSAWLEDSERPVAWLSLDPLDDDPASFLTYLVAAVQTCDPHACRATQALMVRDGSDSPSWPMIARSFAHDLEQVSQPFVLVLDDYHVIAEPDCHAFIVELARRRPPGLQLVIASRRALPLSMGKLRAEGVVTELGAGDLRCSPGEALAFLGQALEGRLDPEAMRLVAERTEGWLLGLRLAALYLRRQEDPAGVAATLTGRIGDRQALDYLTVEVLDRQPPAVQALLVRSAILDRFCAGLCAALLGEAAGEGEGQGQAFVDHIERENLFVVPLDDADGAAGRWYRFHHLFRDLLQKRLRQDLSSGEVATLHGRAADWFAARHLVEEALTHYLAAGDELGVVALIEAHRHPAMNRDRWPQLEGWLRRLPAGMADRHPELTLLEAWTHLNRWRWADLPGRLDRTVALLDAGSRPQAMRERLMGEVEALRGQLHFRVAQPVPAAAAARRALAVTPMAHAVARGVAWVCLGSSLFLTSGTKDCFDALYEGLKEDHGSDQGNPTLILMALCYTYWITADPARMERIAEHLLALGPERDLPAASGWGHYFRGCARYVHNEIEAAAQDFAAVAEQRVGASGETYSQSVIGLAMTHMARGDFEGARSLADALIAEALATANTDVLAEAEAFRALVAQVAGRPRDAERWVRPYLKGMPPRPMITIHIADLSVARLLVTLPAPKYRAAAAALLDKALAFLQATRNTRFRIDVLALQSLLHAGQGDVDTALAELAEALRLAEPGGLVRVLTDLRPGLDPLLAKLSQRGVEPDFVAAVFAAGEPAGRRSAGPEPDLVSLLTFREADVLGLLCQHMMNREIAQALGISHETVKEHTINIYRKLGVRNRREAVARALASGLMAPRTRYGDRWITSRD